MRTRRAKAGCVSRRQAEAKARALASGGRKGASAVTGTVTRGTAADSPDVATSPSSPQRESKWHSPIYNCPLLLRTVWVRWG